MFRWNHKTSTDGAAAAVEEPTRAALVALPDADYIAKAEAAGLAGTPMLIMVQIRDVLAACGLYVYNTSSVETYLDRCFGGNWRQPRSATTWGWIPVNKASKLEWHRHQWWVNGCIRENPIYQGPIPAPVVDTIQALREGVPDLKFFISGEVKRLPLGDPFLAVHHSALTDIVIVERWNEPKFRM